MFALNFLLQLFYSIYNNYGVAIILLTVLVKLILLPLTVKQTRSMLAMQKIQPEMKKIQEKYKDDKQKQSEELMRLYRENKVNPLSGCLPLIMQMPIFIALYMVLRKYVITPPMMLFGNMFSKMAEVAGKPQALQVSGELVRNTGFLGIDNLSETARAAGAAGLVLVILLMASTWYSQKQVTNDPRQKNMMLIMPLLMGFIGYSLPTGVLLYWVTTNILQVAQQAGLRYWDDRKASESRNEVAEKTKKKEGDAAVASAKRSERKTPLEDKGVLRALKNTGGNDTRVTRTGKPLPGGKNTKKDGNTREGGGRKSKKPPSKPGAGKKSMSKPGRNGLQEKAAGNKGAKASAAVGAKTRRKPPPKRAR